MGNGPFGTFMFPGGARPPRPPAGEDPNTEHHDRARQIVQSLLGGAHPLMQAFGGAGGAYSRGNVEDGGGSAAGAPNAEAGASAGAGDGDGDGDGDDDGEGDRVSLRWHFVTPQEVQEAAFGPPRPAVRREPPENR
jgi:hypothetical protein